MELHRNVTVIHQPPVFDFSGLPQCGTHSKSSFFQPLNKHLSWAFFPEQSKLWIQADNVEAALSLEASVLAETDLNNQVNNNYVTAIITSISKKK